MNLISTILLSLSRADSIYVILGGRSASNTYPLVNQTNVSNTYSYYFKNNSWLPGNNPMPGGDGNGSSIWPLLGQSLPGNVYFYDCARINASLPDWSNVGKYYNLATNCFNLANNFSASKGINYNVLWQEGPQDNIYSYNSNYFIDTIQNLIYNSGLSNNWYLSVYTYGGNYRYDKVFDTLFLINNNNNAYLGANIDKNCFSYPEISISTVANNWFNSFEENNRNINIYSIYYLCAGTFDFSGLLFVLAMAFITISIIFGFIYGYKYYNRRKYYQRLQN